MTTPTPEHRYNVTQWGIENPAGALMHGTLADGPFEAWIKFREATGSRAATLDELERLGYVAVRVSFVRVECKRFTESEVTP